MQNKRKIKFRIWDKEQKSMKIPFDFKYNFNPQLVIWKDSILMQYTGLKDKNGKEIYEGDIVECSRYEDDLRYIVEIKDIRELNRWLFGSNLNWRKVIGNIYEDEKLLKCNQK